MSWFLENELYADALECAIQNRDNLQETSVLEVGKQVIKHLMELGYFEKAAVYLKKVYFLILL